jgi:dGTPase
MNDFGAIVAAAALSHDIGNPPFGHSGEKAIGEFFKSGEGRYYEDDLTKKQYQDLCDFEGNANGLKILTESRQGRIGGLRLSYATLGAFTKYPKESLPKKPTTHIADKKYGFFQNEKETFKDIANELGLIKRGSNDDVSYCRHPLVYLVEAADDICYTIIDFEDGINLGLIQEEYALEYLINLVRDSIQTKTYNALQNTQDRLSYLRSLAINTLINEAVDIFMTNEDDILNGKFSKSLLDCSSYEAQINDIIKLSISNVYQSRDVIDKEIIGYKVINELLNTFTKSVINNLKGDVSNFDQLILKVLEPNVDLQKETIYDSLLAVCFYISKMSDSNAMLSYQKLKGNHL